MIIDFHTHIGKDRNGANADFEDLKRSMFDASITKSVAFPFDEEDLTVEEKSLEILNANNRLVIPFLRFDLKTTKEEKARDLLKEDFKGVKLHPRSQDFNPLNEDYFGIYSLIEERNIPLLIHTRKENLPNTDPDNIVQLAEFFPRLKIVLGHFANVSKPAIEAVLKQENLFLETSIFSSPFLIEVIARKVGCEKILFGSDFPFSDQEVEVLKIKKSGLSIKEKEKILYYNALDLLNLKNYIN